MTKKASSVANSATIQDFIALRLAKLYPAHADPTRGGGGGATSEAWMREDPQTIAAAFGAYQAEIPQHRLTSLLLRLRFWPDSLTDSHLLSAQGLTTALLCRQFDQRLPTIPERFHQRLYVALDSDRLALVLLREFIGATPCEACAGRGWTVRLVDDKGLALEAPVRIDCPACRGMASVPWGVRRRAKEIGMRTMAYLHHINPVYARTLRGYHSLADRAARGVKRRLG